MWRVHIIYLHELQNRVRTDLLGKVELFVKSCYLGISHIERDNWAICHGHFGFFSGNVQIADEISAFFVSQTRVHPDVPDSRFRWLFDHFALKEEKYAIEMTT